MPSPRPHLQVAAGPDGPLATLVGCRSLDERLVQIVRAELHDLMDELGGGRLYLNLEQVDYLNSTALGVFVGLHNKLHGLGGQLVLCKPSAQVAEIFLIARLYKVLDIRPEVPATTPPAGEEKPGPAKS